MLEFYIIEVVNKMTKQMVKQNINFLEYPLWFQDERAAESSLSGMTWTDRDGYIYKCGYKPPVKIDGIFLLYLLLQSQKQNYAGKLTLTRYKMIKDCGKTISKVWYDRLEDSLERWKMVGILFEGTFYNGKAYKKINFGILDSWEIDEKTKKLTVRFSPKFLEMMCGKGFFKYINFTEFKQLDSPLAARLYEILSKNFHSRRFWEIDAFKLAEKIPLNKKYPAHIIPKIQSAVNRINKHTDLEIELSIRHKERGKAILIFTKHQTEKQAKITIKQPSFDAVIPDELTEVLQALPESKQKQTSIIEIVQKFYKEFGADYVIRNIKYTRKNAKKNFRPYLLKALKADWGIVIEEDEKEKILHAQLLKIKKKKEVQQVKSNQEEEAKNAELAKKAKDYIAHLSEQDLEKLREEALETLDPKIIDYLLTGSKSATGIGARVTLKAKMETIVKERLSFR